MQRNLCCLVSRLAKAGGELTEVFQRAGGELAESWQRVVEKWWRAGERWRRAGGELVER